MNSEQSKPAPCVTSRKAVTALLLCMLCCAAISLVSLTPAKADTVFTGGSISFALPDGWEAKFDNDSNMFSAASADEECIVVILVFSTSGMSEDEWAAKLAEEFGSPPPEKIEGFSNYNFPVDLDGQTGTATVAVVGYKGMMFLESGNTEKYQADIEKIWYSLTSTNLAENNLFKSLE